MNAFSVNKEQNPELTPKQEWAGGQCVSAQSTTVTTPRVTACLGDAALRGLARRIASTNLS